MVAEITQVNSANLFKAKVQKLKILQFDFEQKFQQKITETKNLCRVPLPENTNQISLNEGITLEESDKQPQKSRVEQALDSLKTRVKEAMEKNSPYSKEEIDNMSLSQLTKLVKSAMRDATSFINEAQNISVLQNIPEDCGVCITRDDNGKCVNFRIFKPDGTILLGDVTQVPDIFTEDDFEIFIKNLSEKELKNFLFESNNPLEVLDSLTKRFKGNNDFDEQLNKKTEATHEQVLLVNKFLNKKED